MWGRVSTAAGDNVAVHAADYADLPYPMVTSARARDDSPELDTTRAVASTVRVPWAVLVDDAADVRKISLLFDQSKAGHMVVDELMAAR